MKSLTTLVTQLGDQLRELKLTLVTAESCTGGGLAFNISCNPTCSALLERGFVTYSNQAKQQLLSVHPESIQLHGAVSKEVALEMAKGALDNSCAQLSIATTGMAGPDKTERQKHGIVWICVASHEKKTEIIRKEMTGTREEFIHRVIEASFEFLLAFLEKHYAQ